jgi:hypothetical protein
VICRHVPGAQERGGSPTLRYISFPEVPRACHISVCRGPTLERPLPVLHGGLRVALWCPPWLLEALGCSQAASAALDLSSRVPLLTGLLPPHARLHPHPQAGAPGLLPRAHGALHLPHRPAQGRLPEPGLLPAAPRLHLVLRRHHRLRLLL